MDTGLPPYISDGIALPVPPGPYLQKKVDMANFLVAADHQQLQAFCDRHINTPIQDGRYRYRVLSSHVLMTYADLNGIAVGQTGLLREHDWCFWVLTLAMKREIGGLYLPSHLAWMVPYIFVDNAYAMAAGREVFGFPKNFGQFHPPAAVSDPTYAVDLMAFDPNNPDAPGEMTWFVKVAQSGTSAAPPPAPWSSREEAVRAVVPHLAGNAAGTAVLHGIEEAIDLFTHLIKPAVRLLFLKQFRSVEAPREACYQAVVECPVRVGDFFGGGLLHHPYEITLNPALSSQYPIAEALGLHLNDGRLSSSLGFWSSASFTLDTGTVVYEHAPGTAATEPPAGCVPGLFGRLRTLLRG